MVEQDDWKIYVEELNKSIRKQRIQEVTAKWYIGNLKRIDEELRFRGVKSRLPKSKEVERAIYFLSGRSPSLVNAYLSAMVSYSKLRWKDRYAILDKPTQDRFIKMSKTDIKEPKYTYEGQLRKIREIEQEDVRMALKLQLMSGVRIREITNVRKKDINLEERKLYIARDKGGGGKIAYIIKNRWFDEEITKFLENYEDDDKPFDSYWKITHRCWKKGIETHDNRRIYIRHMFVQFTEENIKNGMKKARAKREALNKVSKIVGHSTPEMTKRYLGSLWRKTKPIERDYFS